MGSEKTITDFYSLVRVFVMLYGLLVVAYVFYDLSQSANLYFQTVRFVIGLLMIVVGIRPKLFRIFSN